ncbi:MAG: leucyl/phenylalanyl-tRNA--protein transferase [Phycisphaerales bacterium JB040]
MRRARGLWSRGGSGKERAFRMDEAAVVRGLIEAYRAGVFPMAGPGGGVGWYDPDPRGIIPIDRADPAGGFCVPRSVRARVRRGAFEVTSDRAFGEVIRACAAPRAGQAEWEAWIDGRIVAAYEALHRAGHAHSVEAWGVTGGERVLVGGLYGVTVGGLFAGESMFHRADRGGSGASKVCLVHLVAHLRRRGYVLLDTQMVTPVIELMGGVEIPRAEYKERLAHAAGMGVEWGEFVADRMDA